MTGEYDTAQTFEASGADKRVARPPLGVIGLGATVLTAAFVSTEPDDLAFMLPAIAAAWTAIFAALRCPNDRGRLVSWICVACWLWLVWLAANPLWSAWKEMSVWHALLLGCVPAFILGFHRFLADDCVWDRLEWCFFTAAALVAVWMGYEYFALDLRANGPFLDANVASAVLYATLLPLIYRLIVARDSGIRRWVLAALVLLLSVGLFTSFSRGGFGSFAIALVGSAIVLGLRGSRTMLWRFAGCLALIAVAYAAVYFGPQQPHVRSLDSVAGDHSLQMRFVMWDSALDIYADAPLTGVGLGAFSVTYPRYRPLVESGTVGDMAHNDYVQMLAEGGPLLALMIVGFVLCVFAGAVWLIIKLRRTRAGPDQDMMMRDIGLFAALLALAVHATVNFIFYVLMLSLLAGLYAARLAGRYAVTDKPLPAASALDTLRRVVRPFWGVAALISVVVVGTGIVSAQMLKPGAQGGADRVSMDNPDYHLALILSHINPLDYRASFYLGRAEAAVALGLGTGDLGAGLAETSLKDLNHLLAIKHPDCSAQAIKGRLLTTFGPQAATLRKAGVWQDPVKMLRDTIQALPTCMPAYVVLANHWEQHGDLLRAFGALAPAFPWLRIAVVKKRDHARVLTKMAELQAKMGHSHRALGLLDEVRAKAPDFVPARTLRERIETGTLATPDE